MKILIGVVAFGIAMVLVIGIGLIARSSGDGANPSAATIYLDDLRFTPNQLTARVGVPMRVRLTNRTLERHDLNFPSLHMPDLAGVESVLEPGETRTVTLLFDQPGTHTFICSLPGHAAAGMTGAVLVRS